jgi:hypothetical protein
VPRNSPKPIAYRTAQDRQAANRSIRSITLTSDLGGKSASLMPRTMRGLLASHLICSHMSLASDCCVCAITQGMSVIGFFFSSIFQPPITLSAHAELLKKMAAHAALKIRFRIPPLLEGFWKTKCHGGEPFKGS